MVNEYAKIDKEIDKINTTGKLRQMPAKIVRQESSLYIRATFPPKPGELKPKQRKIPTGLKAYAPNLWEAGEMALKIGSQLLTNTWVWPDETPPAETIADYAALHRAAYLSKNVSPGKSAIDTENYWKKDFLYPFNTLPQDQPLTLKLCKDTIQRCLDSGVFAKHSRQQRRYAKAYAGLLKLAGIDPGDLVATMRGGYKPEQADPRQIPSTADIVEVFEYVPEQWRFIYFLIACFGLRGTEVHPERIKIADLDRREVEVWSGKTQDWRYVPAFDKEMFDRLVCSPPDWWRKTPLTPNKLSDAFCKNLCKVMANLDQCFVPYDLRHHYAYDGIKRRIDTALVARWMGHSVTTHTQIYWRCINRELSREVVDSLDKK
jgi:integrase